MTSLADLPAGHTFPPVSFTLDEETSRAYRAATGDTLPLYDAQNAVPPLAVAALALGALMKEIDLPDGTLHGNETLQAHAVVPLGATLHCTPAITRNATRSGMVFTTFEFVITKAGDPVVTSRATVLYPAEHDSSSPERRSPVQGHDSPSPKSERGPGGEV